MDYFYVGVDGGGTSCRARIRDSENNLIGEAKKGSANILLGTQLAMDMIVETIKLAAYSGGLSEDNLKQMHVGLALAAAEHKPSWQEFMNLPHPFRSITLNTDAYGACLGAHNSGNGAIMIAGTGSCGIYIENDKQYVVGGREFPISDQGSGAMMGLHLIQRTLLIADEIEPATPLSNFIMIYFNYSIDQIVAWSKKALPKDYGQFSPMIFKFAEQCDPLAISLLKQTASDIEMFLSIMVKKGAKEICLMGGIGERIKPWLSPPFQHLIKEAKSDAMEGALMYANKTEHNLY